MVTIRLGGSRQRWEILRVPAKRRIWSIRGGSSKGRAMHTSREIGKMTVKEILITAHWGAASSTKFLC